MGPRVGVFGLSGCWGEQIVLLNCEDRLLDIASAVTFVDFLGASSDRDEVGPLDVALVEGSVSSGRDRRTLERVRERAALLVACGSCACFGGIAAMVTDEPREELAAAVYGAGRAFFDIQPHRPLSDFVAVDLCVPGCPMEAGEFLGGLASLLVGDRPLAWTTPVCHECRMNERECLLTIRRLPCAGPITLAGCGARCPAHDVPCIGCRGPVAEANLPSFRRIALDTGLDEATLRRKLGTFAAPVMEAPEPRGEP